jgi:MFS transporter, FHS family, L-fucose permease
MKRNYYIVSLIMLTFFVISFLTNILGALNPDIIVGFHLSLTLVALLPFAFFIAYGVMSIPSGMLTEKYKEKKIMVAGFIVAFFGTLLLAFDPNYLTAVLSLFLIGCGMAMLQVVLFPLLRTSGGEEHYAFTAVLAQLIFGLASFISPRVYSYLVENLKNGNSSVFFSSLRRMIPENLPWISLYWLFAVMCLLMILIIVFSKFPKVQLNKDEEVGALQTHILLFKKPAVILYFIGIFCYVGTEQGMNNWISQFLNTYHGYNPHPTGDDAVSNFWGLMMVGGIVGLLLLKVMDSRKVLVSFTLLAIVSLSLALFGSAGISLVAFEWVGFFLSVMFPVIFSLALNSVKEHHGSFAGILLTGIIGGAVLPLIIGWLGDWQGLRFGMCFLYLTLAYILSVGFWARPIITNKTIQLTGKNKKPTGEVTA